MRAAMAAMASTSVLERVVLILAVLLLDRRLLELYNNDHKTNVNGFDSIQASKQQE
jgi:hypothetical protein